MAPRKQQPDEFVTDAPLPGAGMVLADDVHKDGMVYSKGMAVSALPERLRGFVLADEALAVKAE